MGPTKSRTGCSRGLKVGAGTGLYSHSNLCKFLFLRFEMNIVIYSTIIMKYMVLLFAMLQLKRSTAQNAMRYLVI